MLAMRLNLVYGGKIEINDHSESVGGFTMCVEDTLGDSVVASLSKLNLSTLRDRFCSVLDICNSNISTETNKYKSLLDPQYPAPIPAEQDMPTRSKPAISELPFGGRIILNESRVYGMLFEMIDENGHGDHVVNVLSVKNLIELRDRCVELLEQIPGQAVRDEGPQDPTDAFGEIIDGEFYAADVASETA